ncbi:hypothetical protein [Alkalibacterium sp.]|nr:MAG: hypothetical protein EA249_08265 [Alkalibacterium sp.]
MTETIGRLIIIGLAWAGIGYQLYQYSRIQIPLRKAAFFNNKGAQAGVLIVLLILMYSLSLQPLDWIVVLSATLLIYLSQLNKGFTKSGVIPYEIGTALRAMFSKEYPFEQTTDWVMSEEAESLTFQFNSRQSAGFEKELTFDRRNKEAVLNKLSEENIKVKISEETKTVK